MVRKRILDKYGIKAKMDSNDSEKAFGGTLTRLWNPRK
jgi:hypothetical protein